ncbi:hypothetical protein M885DRAFT_614894 [Pelagophyceae sp. CCMP2097]|nr:hypothetical protein M885DRAFT_614894 [Pelagophyceae sp. CCMP2097]
MPPAAQVLFGTHSLIFGNDVTRILALTLHEFLQRAKARDYTVISLAFTFTPSEPHLLNALGAWGKDETKHECGERFAPEFAPEFVLLQMTHGLLHELVEVLDAVKLTRKLRPAARETTFLVRTQTEVALNKGDPLSAQFHASHADLVAYEAAAELVAAQYDRVVLVPVSAGTVAGIEAGALRHDSKGWHFLAALTIAMLMRDTVNLARHAAEQRRNTD